MKRFLRWVLWIFLGLLVFYLLGPRPKAPLLKTKLPEVPKNLAKLAQYIQEKEAKAGLLKPDNEARIVWNDPQKKQKTRYSIVYIHGFSASQAEGHPVHRNLARRYGANLYLARLEGHGLANPLAFRELSADQLLASAKEAIAIGQQLGEKVLLIASSTGATLSLFLLANGVQVDGLVMYSPLVRIYQGVSYLLDKPWGLQIARWVMGGKYIHLKNLSKASKKYWTNHYRLEGTVALQSLVSHTMQKTTFQNFKTPVFMGYFYKNENVQDKTVSVDAMLKMYEQLGTSSSQKRKKAFPKAGHHVISSRYTSRSTKAVEEATCEFVEEVLGWKALQK